MPFGSLLPHFPTLIITGFCAWAATWLLRAVAHRYGVYSHGGFRRPEEKRTPLLGGVAIYLGICASALLTGNSYLVNILIAAIPIVIVGVCDDIWEIAAKPKYFAQVIAAITWLSLVSVEDLYFFQTGFSPVVTYALCLIWLTGLPNALNFIDGVDGQASITVMLAGIALSFLALDKSLALASITLAFATLGFLIHNWPPARIYLGEVGSSLMGFFLAAISLQLPAFHSLNLEPLMVMFLLCFPLFDLTYAVLRRTLKRTSPLKGDRDHIHHKLQKIGFSRTGTLIITTGATLYGAATGLLLARLNSPIDFMTVALMTTCSLLTIFLAMLYTEHRLGAQVSRYGRPLLERHLKNVDSPAVFDTQRFQAVVFDLLPYYKELQYRGFPVVDAFIEDFASLLEPYRQKRFKVGLLGSYSLVLYSNDSAQWSRESEMKICDEFRKLTENYKIMKSAEQSPDGLYFYSSQNNAQALMRLLKSYSPTESNSAVTENRRAG